MLLYIHDDVVYIYTMDLGIIISSFIIKSRDTVLPPK